jgi:L-rhamnose mutarotase
VTNDRVERRAVVIGLRPESLDEYRRLHAQPWPEVIARLTACHISNYSIFYRDGLLFGYLEYTGRDWEADQRLMAEDPATQRWWLLTDPCQVPVPTAADGEHWAPMEQVFFMA